MLDILLKVKTVSNLKEGKYTEFFMSGMTSIQILVKNSQGLHPIL